MPQWVMVVNVPVRVARANTLNSTTTNMGHMEGRLFHIFSQHGTEDSVVEYQTHGATTSSGKIGVRTLQSHSIMGSLKQPRMSHKPNASALKQCRIKTQGKATHSSHCKINRSCDVMAQSNGPLARVATRTWGHALLASRTAVVSTLLDAGMDSPAVDLTAQRFTQPAAPTVGCATRTVHSTLQTRPGQTSISQQRTQRSLAQIPVLISTFLAQTQPSTVRTHLRRETGPHGALQPSATEQMNPSSKRLESTGLNNGDTTPSGCGHAVALGGVTPETPMGAVTWTGPATAFLWCSSLRYT